MRRIGLALALTAICATTAFAGGSADIFPRDAILHANGEKIRVDVGTTCISSEPDENGEVLSVCADAAPPTEPPRPRLNVAGGDDITLRLPDNPKAQDDPRRVSVALARVTPQGPKYLGGQVKATVTDDPVRRLWKLGLPDDLRNANALDLFVRYRDGGDADYFAGLKPEG